MNNNSKFMIKTLQKNGQFWDEYAQSQQMKQQNHVK